MTAVKVKGLNKYRDRHGKLRVYHRKTGKPIKSPFGSAEFFLELAALDEKVRSTGVLPGSIGMVRSEYLKSDHFRNALAPATQEGYRRYMDLLKPIADMPLSEVDAPFIVAIRDRIAGRRGPRTANYVLAMISVLFQFARERGWWKTENPVSAVKKVRKLKGRPRPNRPWTNDECRTVIREAPPQLRVPIALAMFTGLRKRDVLTLTKQELRNGRVETSKTGEEVRIPIHPDLTKILEAAPARDSNLVATNSTGDAWTESGFNSSFGKFIDRLERDGEVEPGLTFHGLRHTVGTMLAEAGADIDTIRRVLGQKTLAMAQHYTETARKTEATQQLIERLNPLRDGEPLHNPRSDLHNLRRLARSCEGESSINADK